MSGLEKDPRDFTNLYNTKLSPFEERSFQLWAEKNGSLNDLYNYDLRGAWKDILAGRILPDERGHLPDTYKKPNHPTFSRESIYSGRDGYIGGEWNQLFDGSVIFSPGLDNYYSPDELQNYFNIYEKGVHLVDKRKR